MNRMSASTSSRYRNRKPPSRFRVYKNPFSATWRADITVPVSPSGQAYVGTLTRRTDPTGLPTFEGPLSALDSAVMRKDVELAGRSQGAAPGPAFLALTELPRATPRQRPRRLTATLLLASGIFRVEARYSTGDAQIIGRITRDIGGSILTPNAICTRQGATAPVPRRRRTGPRNVAG